MAEELKQVNDTLREQVTSQQRIIADLQQQLAKATLTTAQLAEAMIEK